MVEEHDHVNRQIINRRNAIRIPQRQDQGARNAVTALRKQLVQRGMTAIMPSGLGLYRKHLAILDHQEINLPDFLRLEIMQLKAMCAKLLRNEILVNGPVVDVYRTRKNAVLNVIASQIQE